MDGQEFKAIRASLKMTAEHFGRALGFQGKPLTVRVQIYRLEKGLRPIPPWIGRLAQAYSWLDRFGVRPGDITEPYQPPKPISLKDRWLGEHYDLPSPEDQKAIDELRAKGWPE